MIDAPAVDVLLNEIAAAISKGCMWVVGRIGRDGHPGAKHCHYYRLPWMLALTGHRAEASAVLSWVEREALDAAGDLRAGTPRAGFESRWASYPLAILATGAWHLERYDTAVRLARRLEVYQHPDTGGAFAAHPDKRVDERQDLFPTAQLGMTGLTTGRMELADKAFRWIEMMYRAQPDLPHRLYTATDGCKLVVDFASDDLAWQMVTDFNKPRQAFYNPGIAAAFLGRYYLVTGNSLALDLARQFLDLTVGGTEAQFDYTDSVQVCKFGWGAAVLLDATGDEQYLGHTFRMAQWFLASQNGDGTWDNSPFLMSRGGDRNSIRVEITAEFIQHLVTIATALSGRRSRKVKAGA